MTALDGLARLTAAPDCMHARMHGQASKQEHGSQVGGTEK